MELERCGRDEKEKDEIKGPNENELRRTCGAFSEIGGKLELREKLGIVVANG